MNQPLQQRSRYIVFGLFLSLFYPAYAEGLLSDKTADLVLGQLDMSHNSANLVDGRGLNAPRGVAIDRSVSPNRVYVSDILNNRVLAWSNAASFENGAMADRVIGQPDFAGDLPNNGTDSTLVLWEPSGVAVDGSGNLYVADTRNNRVVEYDSPFTTDTAADRVFGQPDFSTTTCNEGGLGAGSLCSPEGIALDASGNLYVADRGNARVLEYDSPLTTDAVADRVIGQSDFLTNACDNGVAISASGLCFPAEVAVDSAGNLYVADKRNNRVLEYDDPLNTDALADRVFGQPDFAGGDCNKGGVNASGLCSPTGLALDGAGNLFVADSDNNRILEYDTPLTTDAVADRVFGQPNLISIACNDPFPARSPSSLCYPQGLALDESGALFVADSDNNAVLTYNAPLTTDAVADRALGQYDLYHSNINLTDLRGFYRPFEVTLDRSVVPNRVYAGIYANCSVLGWTNADTLSNGQAADLILGESFLSTCYFRGNNSSSESLPTGTAVDRSGNLYVGDRGFNRVLVYISPFTTDTVADYIIGQPDDVSNTCNNGGISASSICDPTGITVDDSGTLYVLDRGNDRLLIFEAPLTTDAVADHVMGQPDFVSNGCNNGGISASTLCKPLDLTLDKSGNLFVSDESNHRILKYEAPLTTDAVADLVIGQADFVSQETTGCSDDGVSAGSLCFPFGMVVDALGSLYASDGKNRVLRYDPPFSNNMDADDVIGQPDFVSGTCNNGGLGASSLCFPATLDFDRHGNLYVVDTNNHRLLKYYSPNNPAPAPAPDPAPEPSAPIADSPANHPPTASALIFPANGAAGLGPDVTFGWNSASDPDGNALTYTLRLCEDARFTIACNTSDVASATKGFGLKAFGLGIGLIFGLVFIGGPRSGNPVRLFIIAFIFTASLFISCSSGGNNTPPSNIENSSAEMTKTLIGLKAATTYYWKVEADDGNGGASESETRSFTTL